MAHSLLLDTIEPPNLKQTACSLCLKHCTSRQQWASCFAAHHHGASQLETTIPMDSVCTRGAKPQWRLTLCKAAVWYCYLPLNTIEPFSLKQSPTRRHCIHKAARWHHALLLNIFKSPSPALRVANDHKQRCTPAYTTPGAVLFPLQTGDLPHVLNCCR